MFRGAIVGTGARYCPSVEDKVVRFADQDAHPVFLEPEGRGTHEVYLQGFTTSMPAWAQEAIIRSIRGLEQAEILRYGYAIEYAGSAIEGLSMEGRLTLCNMTIEAGSRTGMVAPDDKTIDYVKGRPFAPGGGQRFALGDGQRFAPGDVRRLAPGGTGLRASPPRNAQEGGEGHRNAQGR